MWQIIGKDLAKQYNQRTIFQHLSFEIQSGESLVLIGPNGAGKTTLIRTVCNLQRADAGQINFFRDGKEQSPEQLYSVIGLVGPYLQLYNQLTALENFTFFAKIRGLTVDISHFKFLMAKFGLINREWDELRTFSSGMLQRMKYVCALLHQPEILILDEPTSNLDDAGTEIVYQLINEQKATKILIYATNDSGEIAFGDKKIQLAA